MATAAPFVPNEAPIARVAFALGTHAIYSPLSFCKGPQAWLYVLAARERQQRGLDELVLLSAAGHVAETTSAAIFWVKDEQLYTPALATGCVAGVHRAHLLARASSLGIATHEVLAAPEELLQAEAVLTANVAGWRWVAQLQEHHYAPEHPAMLTHLLASK
ncbi:aminotransferase class IV [Hymenobacter sp. J193]|nr:aminotransferase class IV [Hymenobacter sp. J193]MCR5890056.1 aminotransferase class IV [Hymenobacter sp. J193]